MMHIKFHKGYVYLKNDWSEISTRDFLFLMKQFAAFAVGKIDKLQLQTNWLYHCIKIDRPKKTDSDKYYENIYQIAREFKFLFDENDKPNLNFAKFFITKVRIWWRTYSAPVFEVKNQIPITTLTTEQFIDAFSIYIAHADNQKPEMLQLLISILFTNPYNNQKAIVNSSTFRYLNPVLTYGVYIQFISLLHFLKDSFPYLFYETQSEKPVGYNLGFAESMYGVIESGYGSQAEVAKMNLFDYLNILTKKRLEVIRLMKQNKKNDIEIHNETGIPYELIERV